MIAGVLLAAGESTRMGQLKALLPWRGTTLLESQVSALVSAGVSPLVVVLGHRAAELRALLPVSAQVALNERYREGKSTSIVAGISALPASAEAALVVAVDQPTEAGVLRALLSGYSDDRPVVLLPSVNHRRGHPTLFDRRLFADLVAITEEREGLREVMDRYEGEIGYVDVDTELVRANLNSPEEYEAAYSRWGR
ncbi:MAG TPA: nucleotidyltransferase family protein [Chloroflexota bacterium]|nr:nucleotidyltransferase family protein [Chloroflexota bacterium]